MHDYYRLLAVIEQELILETAAREASLRGERRTDVVDSTGTVSGSSSKSPGNTLATVSDEKLTPGSGITLLKLRTWLQEPIERFAYALVRCFVARS